jgi:site-specific DNA recombinase
MFKIPDENATLPPPDTDEGSHDDGSPVRTMVRLVGRRGLEPRT